MLSLNIAFVNMNIDFTEAGMFYVLLFYHETNTLIAAYSEAREDEEIIRCKDEGKSPSFLSEILDVRCPSTLFEKNCTNLKISQQDDLRYHYYVGKSVIGNTYKVYEKDTENVEALFHAVGIVSHLSVPPRNM